MTPYVNDNMPFHRMMKDVTDKIEENRKRFVEERKRTRIGTFAGLEDLIAKRKKETQNAERSRD